jgi:DNA processing protein
VGTLIFRQQQDWLHGEAPSGPSLVTRRRLPARRLAMNRPTMNDSNMCSITCLGRPTATRQSGPVAGGNEQRGPVALDTTTRLQLAIAGTRPGRGPAGLMRQARRIGVTAFYEVLEGLDPGAQASISEEARALASENFTALIVGVEGYPTQLAAVEGAPPVLFCRGPTELLTSTGIGICGSRNVSDEGLRAATACGEAAAEEGLTVISGYARGVDMASHVAALKGGGRTIVVLPEGITRFRVRRGELASVWNPSRSLVVSQFSPTQPWSASAAMMRNVVIFGLGLALVVVEADRRVVALEFAEIPRGNAMLLRRGAIPVRDRSEFVKQLKNLALDPGGNQLCIGQHG